MTTALETKPAAGPASGPSAANKAKLPTGFSLDAARPAEPNASDVTVFLDLFELPRPKGSGEWVQKAYNDAAAGGRLGVTLMYGGNSPAAWKEDSATPEYLGAWLSRWGFKSPTDMKTTIVTAAKTDPKLKTAIDDSDVKGLLAKVHGGLSAIKCDIDHIVEKQMGGTSQPSNLQLLTSTVNQESGREAYKTLKAIGQGFIDSDKMWGNVRRLNMRLKAAKVPAGVEDASVKFENLLRAFPDLGKATVKTAAEGKPVFLSAGGAGETVMLKDSGKTEIDSVGTRIVPGMRLEVHSRGPAKTLPDTVTASLDHRAMEKSQTKGKGSVTLIAKPGVAKAAPATAPDAPAPGPATLPTGMQPGAEVRELSLDKSKPNKIEFFYPYLSPGTIDTLEITPKGAQGTGTITPSVKFLGPLAIRFGPDELLITKPIDVAAMNASPFMKPLGAIFRFTDGKFEIDLMKFIPSGTVAFSMGKAEAPVMTGNVTAKVDGGAFVAIGTMVPGKLPGLSAGKGEVSYNSTKGWAGSVHASSSSFPGIDSADVTIGFKDANGKIDFYGGGSLGTKVKGADLSLKARWEGSGISYWGQVVVPKPLPLVDSITLSGSYKGDEMVLTGAIDNFTYKNKFAGKLKVTYRRKTGEADGKISGSVHAESIAKDKIGGAIDLNLEESGAVFGKGDLSYQVTKDIRPKLGVELTRDQRLRLYGDVVVANIPLGKEWPKPGGERRDLIKGLGAKFSVPTPIPGVTAFGAIRGSFGVAYGIGPVSIRDVKFNGELWPLEDDPKVKAKLTGKLAVPAFGELYGKFGAEVGAEVLLGAAGVKGGIDVTPALRVTGEAGLDVNADYDAAGFSFGAKAYAKGSMVAKLGVDLQATVYGAYGLLEHTWTYPVGKVEKKLGPELNLTLGEFKYAKNGEITWPSFDQITVDPSDFDPLAICRELMSEGKADKA